jgi:hypothetical protein
VCVCVCVCYSISLQRQLAAHPPPSLLKIKFYTARYDVAASGGGGALSANVVSSEKNQLRLFASSSQIRILTDGCLGLLNVYSTLRAWLCFV